VFGIFGALGAWHFRRRRDIPERIVREVRRSAIPFLGFNLLIALGIPGIDQAAHIGGFAAGLLSGLILAGTRATDLQAGRQLRLLGLSCLALLITAAGILQLPGSDEVPGLMGELQRTGRMEERLLSVYRSAALQVDSGRMSREDYAAVLRQEILPEWNQCIERLRSTGGNLSENPAVLRLIQYLQLRAESWVLSAEAVETDNQELMTRSHEKWSEADRIAEQLAQEQQNQ
jgi:rhomboid protease GluP